MPHRHPRLESMLLFPEHPQVEAMLSMFLTSSPSSIIGPGNYTGGELWIYDGRIPHCVRDYEGTGARPQPLQEAGTRRRAAEARQRWCLGENQQKNIRHLSFVCEFLTILAIAMAPPPPSQKLARSLPRQLQRCTPMARLSAVHA